MSILSIAPDPSPFMFEGVEIRAQLNEWGEPEFIAADLCRMLGIANSRDALARIPSDEKGVATTDTLGGPQQMATLTEPGMYRLVMTSRRPEADRFVRWVTHDVLPALRKTGTYSTPEISRTDLLAHAVLESQRWLAEKDATIAELTPAAEAWRELASTDGDMSVNEAAKCLSRDESIQIGQNRLFAVLKDIGWLYRTGDRPWEMYQRPVELGYLAGRVQSHRHPKTGVLVIDPPQVRVTPKGLNRLRRMLTTRAATELVAV